VSTNATGVAMVHRLSRDVLAQGGAETLVVFAGINDLRWGSSALEVVGGLTEVAETARAHGMRVFVATLGPCGGELRCTAEVDEARQYVNSFLREQNDLPDSVFDGVWDFDAVLRDPQAPSRLLPEYDSGAHLNPGAPGLHALAHSIYLGERRSRECGSARVPRTPQPCRSGQAGGREVARFRAVGQRSQLRGTVGGSGTDTHPGHSGHLRILVHRPGRHPKPSVLHLFDEFTVQQCVVCAEEGGTERVSQVIGWWSELLTWQQQVRLGTTAPQGVEELHRTGENQPVDETA